MVNVSHSLKIIDCYINQDISGIGLKLNPETWKRLFDGCYRLMLVRFLNRVDSF